MRVRTVVGLVVISLCTVGCSKGCSNGASNGSANGDSNGSSNGDSNGNEHSEPAGAAEYYVHNRSSHDLIVECSAKHGSQVNCQDGGYDALPGDVVELARDAIFGVTPRPTDSFKAVSASAVPPGATEPVVVYQQDPIDNAAWVQKRLDSHDYGSSRYTLVLEDSDIVFP